jgi:hypothetical protein
VKLPWRGPVAPALVISLVALLVLGIAAAAGGTLLLTRSQRMADLQASLSSYLRGDCRATVERYTAGTRGMLLGSPADPSPEQRKAVQECRTLLDARGDDVAKLTTYARLARSFGDSPTRSALRRDVEEVTKRSDALATKATGAVCSSILTLRFFDLLPTQENTLPALFIACGRIYGASKQAPAQVNALTLYRTVRTNYPRHPLFSKAVAAEAKLRIAQISEYGYSYDGVYTPTRKGSGSRSKLTVRNDSPATLIVAILGAKQARVLEIPPCESCSLQKSNSYTCKTSTPRRTVLLPRGRYRMSWEYVQPGLRSNTSTSTVNLARGGAYEDCNYLYIPA